MGIEYTLYLNTRNKPHLSRQLTALATGEAPESVIDSMDLINPVFVVKNSDYLSMAGANYLFLGAPFNRYYFLGAAHAGEDGLTRIPAHVDVLYTYKSVILNSSCIAKRSSSNFDIGLQDPMVQYRKGYVYNFSKFNYTFTPGSGEYILQVGGR